MRSGKMSTGAHAQNDFPIEVIEAMFFRRRRQNDFSLEIKSHIEHEAAQLRQEGLSHSDAYYAARRTFGNLAAAEEHFYERSRWMFWDEITKDLQFTFR